MASKRYEEYGRAWYLRNRDRRIAAATANRVKHRDAHNQRQRERYSARYKLGKFAKLYNASKEEMAKWLGITSCQLCGSPDKMTTDHCHTSGKIRGRLCTRCNTGLGMFLEDPELMLRAAEYIRRFSAEFGR